MVNYGQVPGIRYVAESLARIEQEVGDPVHGVADLVLLVVGEANLLIRNQLEETVLAVFHRAGAQIQQQLSVALSLLACNRDGLD